jgi:hypothetical protein
MKQKTRPEEKFVGDAAHRYWLSTLVTLALSTVVFLITCPSVDAQTLTEKQIPNLRDFEKLNKNAVTNKLVRINDFMHHSRSVVLPRRGRSHSNAPVGAPDIKVRNSNIMHAYWIASPLTVRNRHVVRQKFHLEAPPYIPYGR